MALLKKARNFFKKVGTNPFFRFLTANILFSMSTFLVNLSLPIILQPELYTRFVYVFQMVFFLTTLFQFGIVVGLYKFYDKNKDDIFNVYYSLVLFINTILILLSFNVDNIVSKYLKLNDFSIQESVLFYMSVIVLGIFLFNKGKNVIEKSFKYMLVISANVFIYRIIVICILSIYKVESLSLILFLVFILPFVRDIRDYIVSTFHYVRPFKLKLRFLKSFVSFIIKVWITGILYTISDKIFLISTKGLNSDLTTAISFSSGFVGIISIFTSSFSNFFLAKFSTNNINDIANYVNRLKRFSPVYFLSLVLLDLIASVFIYYSYSQLANFTALITFITLLRMGLISYLGLFTLLGKILNLLRIEIFLNIFRIVVIYCLCNFWHPENYILWYTIVVFTVPFPELLFTFIIFYKINKMKALTSD